MMAVADWATLREETWPIMGRRPAMSQFSRTRRDTPSCSLPMTSRILPFRFTSQISLLECSVAAHAQKPFFLKRSMAPVMLDVCAMSRCATAPAELLYVDASTRALRLLGMIRPEAPTDSAERMMAPRLPASVMWSHSTTSARPSCSAAYVSAAPTTSPRPTYGKGFVSAMTP